MGCVYGKLGTYMGNWERIWEIGNFLIKNFFHGSPQLWHNFPPVKQYLTAHPPHISQDISRDMWQVILLDIYRSCVNQYGICPELRCHTF
jgi:hypothetical protein